AREREAEQQARTPVRVARPARVGREALAGREARRRDGPAREAQEGPGDLGPGRARDDRFHRARIVPPFVAHRNAVRALRITKGTDRLAFPVRTRAPVEDGSSPATRESAQGHQVVRRPSVTLKPAPPPAGSRYMTCQPQV